MEQTRSSGWVDRWKKLIKFRQQADPGNQGLHVQCQQTIAAVTYNQMADLTNGVRQLEQQLRMALADLTNRVRQLEEKGEEEELASHMKNLNLKWNWFYWGCAPPPTSADILRAFKV